MAIVMLPFFSREVNSLDDHRVQQLHALLHEGVRIYGGTFTNFAIDHGVVFFGTDSEEMVSAVLVDIERLSGVKAQVFPDEAAFTAAAKKILTERR